MEPTELSWKKILESDIAMATHGTTWQMASNLFAAPWTFAAASLRSNVAINSGLPSLRCSRGHLSKKLKEFHGSWGRIDIGSKVKDCLSYSNVEWRKFLINLLSNVVSERWKSTFKSNKTMIWKSWSLGQKCTSISKFRLCKWSTLGTSWHLIYSSSHKHS